MARNSNDRENRDWRDYHHPAMSYETPTQLRRFRAGVTLLLSTLLVAGLWTGLWFAASAYMQAQVTGFFETQASQGGAAAYESMELSGFPSRINVTLSKPRYAGMLSGTAAEWRGETLTLSTRPWLPWRVRIDAPGRHEVELADGRASLSGQVARLGADVVLGGAWPERVSLDLEGLDLSGSATVVMDALAVVLEYDADVQTSGSGLTVQLSGANITLPLGGGWGLGDTVESIDVALRVLGPVHPGPFVERLVAWRDVGGALEFERLKLRFGPLAAAAAGTVALNGDLQPIGAMTAKFEGLFQVLGILRDQGLVRDGDAVLATMALSALSKRPANGGVSAINLAVTVQDGTLSLGQVPVLALPAIDWGLTPQTQVETEPAPVRDYKDVPAIY